MKKSWKVILGLLLVVTFTLAAAAPGLSKEPNQTKCPVLGSPVSKRVFTDYQGKRIYFCCPPCIREFKKNPDKFMKQMEEQGVVLEPAPKNQP